MSYEGLDDDGEFEIVPIVNNNDANIVSYSDSDDDIKNNNDNFFDEYIDDKVEVTSHTTINAKVVCAIKKLQALCNDDANKIVEQATKEKIVIENLNLLIDLTMVTNKIKPVPKEPQIFNKASDHPNENSHKKWQ